MINDDRVKITPIYEMEPHPISPCGDEDFGYQTVKNSIRQIWNNTRVAPGRVLKSSVLYVVNQRIRTLGYK